MIARLLATIALLFLLSSCVSITPEQASKIRRIVIVDEVDAQITRHHLGFTAFTNKASRAEPAPELADVAVSAARAALAKKFPHATVEVYRGSDMKLRGDYWKGWDFKQAIPVATKHNADAVLALLPFDGAPVGIPQYMKAKTYGLWHHGRERTVGSLVDPQVVNFLLDGKTGKFVAFAGHVRERTILPISWRDTWSSYTASERSQIKAACLKILTTDIVTQLERAGLK
jgi:hypothetical protein